MLWVDKHFYFALYFLAFKGHNSLSPLMFRDDFFFPYVGFYLGAWGFGFFIVILWLRGFPSFCSHRRCRRLLLLLLLLICNKPPHTHIHHNRLLGLLLFVFPLFTSPPSPRTLISINRRSLHTGRGWGRRREGRRGISQNVVWNPTHRLQSNTQKEVVLAQTLRQNTTLLPSPWFPPSLSSSP